MKRGEDGETASIRITQQFRSGQAMVYDLRDARSSRLTLRVTARGEESSPPTAWRIEASTSTAPGSSIVVEQAETRVEALRAVARAWNDKRLAHDLPTFDWAIVERALADVRAL